METSRTERISYAFLAASGTFLFALTEFYLLYFYTDILIIPAVAVTFLFIVTKMWDAVNDQLIGYFISNKKSKHGRYRPYILLAGLPASLLIVFLFMVPDIPVLHKIIYAYIVYFIWNPLHSTQNIVVNALLPMMSKSQQERILLNSYRIIFSVAAVLIVSSTTLQLTGFFEKFRPQTGFALTALAIGLATVPMQIFAFKNIKERHDLAAESEKSVKKAVQCLCSDKKLLLIMAMFFTFWFGTALKNQSAIYYIKYVLATPDRIGDFFLIGVSASLVMQCFVNKITCKVNIETAMAAGIFGSFTGMIVMAAAGANFVLFNIGNIVCGLMSAIPSNLIYVVIAGYGDELSLKYNFNSSGWLYATLSFLAKLATGISGAVCAFILHLTDYSAGQILSEAAITGIKLAFLGGTPTALIVSFIIMIIYITRKKEKKESMAIKIN